MSYLWLLLTLLAFALSSFIYQRSGRNPLLLPMLLAIVLLIALLLLSEVSYQVYTEDTRWLEFLLGPAVIALAVPLYRALDKVKLVLVPLIITSIIGGTVAVLVALLVAQLLGASTETQLAMASKSVTTPIALNIADQIGASPSLASGFVLITGTLGCLLSPWVCRILKAEEPELRGFSLGVAAHAMGTASAFEYGATAAAFAGLAMGLTGMFTAFLLPILFSFIG